MFMRRRGSVPLAALIAVGAGLAVASVVGAGQASAATGCRVDYKVSSQWQGGFGGDVTVTNLGSAVNGWTLTWSFSAGQAVTQAWNATVTQTGSAVTAKNVSYNAVIAPDAAVTFGFNSSWNNSTNPVPASFALSGVTCTGATTAPTGGPTTTRSPTTAPATTRPPSTTAPPRNVRVYVAGDSTASTYTSASSPRTGWGQALPVFFTSYASVVNVAQSGASSKSFIDQGRLDHILSLIQGGDYLLISFGHNDEKSDDPARYTIPSTTYKSYLTQYIDKSRAKGAIPILITPVERRKFNSAGVISASHGAYPAAMRELAAAKSVPLIDLTASSTAMWNRLGVDGTTSCFMIFAAGRYANYPSGSEDNTHFQAHGAIEVARLIAAALNSQSVMPSADFRQLTATIPDSAITWPSTAPY
jgi:lysophospholipase L1-like esterase